MKLRHIAVLTALLTLCLAPVSAGARPMRIEDLLGFRTIEDLRVAPDGRTAVVVVRQALLDENRFESDLYLVPLDGNGSVRRLTATSGSENSPRFSPDGLRLAFVAARGGPAQVWVLPVGGGEARALTSHPGPVAGFDWAPDGERILYIAEPGETTEEKARREGGDDAWVLGRQWRNQRLYVAPAKPRAPEPPRPLTDGTWHVREDAAWSPDGRSVAWIATPTAELDASEEARVQVLQVGGGAVAAIPGSERASSFAWDPRGGGLYFVRPFDGRGWSREDLFLWKPGDLTSHPVGPVLDRDVEAVRFVRRSPAPRVLYSRGAEHEVAVLEPGKTAGGPATEAPGRLGAVWRPGSPVDLLESAPGGWVYVRGDRPDEVWIAGEKGEPRRLTRFNAALEQEVDLPRLTSVTWTSDDRSIQGVLTGPAATALPIAGSQAPAPLLVRPHGGPRAHSMARFDPLNAWLAALGYNVLEPNFRGSTGYGDAFAKANGGDWGDGPFRDVMAGVDALIARGLADPERLFLYGWSYGGIMANWAATHTTRFRAIVSGAGVADLRMQYVLSDARRWRFDYFGGSPFAGHRPAYEKDSPVTNVGGPAIVDGGAATGDGGPGGAAGERGGERPARTPVLFIQGEVDDRCPVPQALMMHRALLDAGHESALVLYPREGHGFREPRHILDRALRVAAWLARHGSRLDPGSPAATDAITAGREGRHG
jgi:dipeptidyl aminopeptidase/acylaminoacyl peptidase